MVNEFVIDTEDEELKFVANKNTGLWVLTNKSTESIKNNLAKPFVQRDLSGSDMIALNMGRQCNFSCIYCLVGNLKESKKQLTLSVGKKALERIVEMHQKKPPIVVFHGSEAMLNYELMVNLVHYGLSLREDVEFCIQTNGSLLTQEKIKELSDLGIGMGISIDGLERHHNKTRPFKNGEKSYQIVRRNLHLAKERQGDISVITVVTTNNVHDLREIFRDYNEQGIRAVSFNPVNTQERKDIIPTKKDLIENIQGVCDDYLNYLSSGKKTTKVENLKRYISMLFRPKTTSSCIQCGAGPANPLLAIDVDGAIYPCDYFWGNEDFKIGNIEEMSLTEAASSPKNFRNSRSIEDLTKCNPCNWKLFCGGGCYGEKMDKSKEDNLYCEYNDSMLTYVVRKLPRIHKEKLLPLILSK